jgi:hypothetical protein
MPPVEIVAIRGVRCNNSNAVLCRGHPAVDHDRRRVLDVAVAHQLERAVDGDQIKGAEVICVGGTAHRLRQRTKRGGGGKRQHTVGFDGPQTATVDERAGRVIETVVYEDRADALDLDAVAASDHRRQGLGKGRHAIDDADIDRLGQVVRRTDRNRVGHRHDRRFVVVDAAPRAGADEADLTGVFGQAIRVDLKTGAPGLELAGHRISPTGTHSRTRDQEDDRDPPEVRRRVTHQTPPTPRMVLSEAAENSKTRTADSPHRSRNALALQAMPAACTAQSPKRTVFLITLSGFGTNRGCFRRLPLKNRQFSGKLLGNQTYSISSASAKRNFENPKS